MKRNKDKEPQQMYQKPRRSEGQLNIFNMLKEKKKPIGPESYIHKDIF
jgi:hypothetical protein